MNNIHNIVPLTRTQAKSNPPQSKDIVIVAYTSLKTPENAIRDILVKHHRQNEAEVMFAIYPEIRALAERTTAWITEIYPTLSVYPTMLEGALLRSMDAYALASRPRANQNDALHAFVNTFCASAAEMSRYSVMAIKASGERLYWQLFSKPLGVWLQELNPHSIEFRLIPDAEQTLSADLVRTYFACHVVDFNTLHGLESKAKHAG